MLLFLNTYEFPQKIAKRLTEVALIARVQYRSKGGSCSMKFSANRAFFKTFVNILVKNGLG